MMDEHSPGAPGVGEGFDALMEKDGGFDPRLTVRRWWREALAAAACCVLVVSGAYAVGITHGEDAAAVRVAEAEVPARQFATDWTPVQPSIPETLARPALSADPQTPARTLDYAALDNATLERVAGLSVERFTVKSGDTLGRILTGTGVATQQSAAAIAALKDVWDPRHLRVGQEVSVYLYTSPLRRVANRPDSPDLVGLALKPAVDRTVAVAMDRDGSYQAREEMMELERTLVRVNGSIDSALWNDLNAAGATDRIIGNFANLFSFSVDIQREVRRGDDFEILYEEFRTSGGDLVKTGDIVYAALETRGALKQLYRFEAADGPDYFDAEGVSIRRFLMRTPINGARLSSHFGMRRHPIQGYNRLHKGTDFAAPRGTPIYAAGDGVIARQYRSPSYGNYILIRHNSTWQTAYAHMHNFATGMREGRRVRQGEVIGYVGTTGNSTGPHLHYEVLQNGNAVDPMSVRVPTGKELEGDELRRFTAAINGIRVQYADAPDARDMERVAVAAAQER